MLVCLHHVSPSPRTSHSVYTLDASVAASAATWGAREPSQLSRSLKRPVFRGLYASTFQVNVCTLCRILASSYVGWFQ